VVSVNTYKDSYSTAPHRTALLAFSIRQKRRKKSVTQELAAAGSERRNCGVVRRVASRYGMTETTRECWLSVCTVATARPTSKSVSECGMSSVTSSTDDDDGAVRSVDLNNVCDAAAVACRSDSKLQRQARTTDEEFGQPEYVFFLLPSSND